VGAPLNNLRALPGNGILPAGGGPLPFIPFLS
jgi:hypothetical protein